MTLRDVPYQEDYRTGYDDLVREFFRPSLQQSHEYWRAVGYFSSSSLESFGSPLGDFLHNDGHIRLVTSVELTQTDLDAVSRGADKQEICQERLEAIIESDFADGVGSGVSRLIRLLQIGRLEIRFAVPKAGTGIYHEKIGLFFDASDFVAFTGSSNESKSALENNRECIDVYPSWQAPSRANRKRTHFEELWEGRDQGVETFLLPEAIKRRLLRVGTTNRGRPDPSPDKWRHQSEAIEAFMAAERGILNMATGTGKTRTALRILKELFTAGKVDTAIVAMDGNDLLKQWYIEILQTGRDLTQPARVYRDFQDAKEVQDFSIEPGERILLVTRQSTSTRNPLAMALRGLGARSARTILIHDEVHRLGSYGNQKQLDGLSDDVRYRLGLSATPERDYDDEGNAFIEGHIGPTLLTFQLEDAIRRGILAPFNYFPLEYQSTDDDRRRIKAVYAKKALRAAAGEPMSDKDVSIELARVHKTSTAKLPVFGEFIASHSGLLKRCIIFVETQEYGDQVLGYIHEHRSDFHTYYEGEKPEVFSRFARGDLQCLVTCHRLSEGIDIRSLNTVVLFSSARARLETIQRIGRCLRVDPDNPQKIANIVDFIRHTEDPDAPSADADRAQWLRALSTVRTDRN